MKKSFLCICIVVSLLQGLLVACQNPEPDASNKLVDCVAPGAVIKTAQQVRGYISVLDADHPDLWVIVSEQGIIGNTNPIYDGPDIVLPCNLPDSLRKQDVRVLFSGELRYYQGPLTAWTSTLYNSRLTAIEVR
jgi:hypothetical protein